MADFKNTADVRSVIGARFRIMCADAGLDLDAVAQLLQVTPRTVRYWFSGKTMVPYSAYKLMRIQCRFELPGRDWVGWHMHSGKLWTPEGHGFIPSDSNWWGLLVRKARQFGVLYARQNAFNQAMNENRPQGKTAGRPDAPDGPANAAGSPPGRGELVEPTGMAGGAAQPPRLIYLKNTTRQNNSTKGSVIGETSKTIAWQIAHKGWRHERAGWRGAGRSGGNPWGLRLAAWDRGGLGIARDGS